VAQSQRAWNGLCYHCGFLICGLIIVMPELTAPVISLLVAVAFCAGLVSSMAGAGGLITLPALLWAGLPPLVALGSNKVQSALGTLVSTAKFVRSGHLELRVARTGLPALELAASDAVVVGDPVVAVGAPLGLESTVTTGIVSALNRPVSAGNGDESAFINAIQTDAAINPGNSGGPLVDLQGRVIGVNSAIARAPGSGLQGAGNIGLGFAIPSTQAARTAQEIIDTGRATYPVIGVLLDSSYRGEGVKVVEETPDDRPVITPGGPADRAGIRPGDLIVAFEGRPVTDPDELIVAIRAQRPGDSVTLTVRRDGQDRDVTLELEEAESD